MKEKVKENQFRFAERGEQNKKINQFMCISTTLLNIVAFLIVFVSYLRGYRTVTYTFGLLGVMVVTSVIGFILYARDKQSNKVRYVIFIGLFINSMQLAYGFNSYYMRVMSTLPLIAGVLFFDIKFASITGIMTSVGHFGVTLFRQFGTKDYVDAQFMDNLTICVVIWL